MLAKALCGGALVLAFAALSESLKPKRFAGILAAAPAVAVAGLVVGSFAKGPLEQAAAARMMIAGAVALTVCAAVLVPPSRPVGCGVGVDGRLRRVDRRRKDSQRCLSAPLV